MRPPDLQCPKYNRLLTNLLRRRVEEKSIWCWPRRRTRRCESSGTIVERGKTMSEIKTPSGTQSRNLSCDTATTRFFDSAANDANRQATKSWGQASVPAVGQRPILTVVKVALRATAGRDACPHDLLQRHLPALFTRACLGSERHPFFCGVT